MRDVKTKNPKIRQFVRLLGLDGEDLKEGNLKTHQKTLWKDFENEFNATFLIVKSDFDKEFAFYIPCKFENISY